MPDEQIARCEGIGLVRLGLETLDDRSRELIRLKFNENLSYKEISARTGLNTGHVGYLLHHTLKAIAEELAQKWSHTVNPEMPQKPQDELESSLTALLLGELPAQTSRGLAVPLPGTD